MATATKLSMLAVQMPADLAERFRQLAEKNGRTVQQEIRRALREHVEREEG
jgi:predicted transcriptional regulator